MYTRIETYMAPSGYSCPDSGSRRGVCARICAAYIYIYIYAISQGGCARICAINFSPESSFSRNSFVWQWVFQGFCMFYVHLCRLKSSLSLTWGQPAGLPGTRGYAPHMRQVFFLDPAREHFSTARSASLPLQGVCTRICAVYIYIYMHDFSTYEHVV